MSMTPEMDEVIYDMMDGKVEELSSQLDQGDYRKALDVISELEDYLGELRTLIAEESTI